MSVNIQEIVGFTPVPTPSGYVDIAKRSTIVHGKTHYFDWVIFNSYLKLPKGPENPWIIRCFSRQTCEIIRDLGHLVSIFDKSWKK